MDRTDRKPDDGRDLQHDAPLDDELPRSPDGGAAVSNEPETREHTLPGPGDRPAGFVVDPHPRS